MEYLIAVAIISITGVCGFIIALIIAALGDKRYKRRYKKSEAELKAEKCLTEAYEHMFSRMSGRVYNTESKVIKKSVLLMYAKFLKDNKPDAGKWEYEQLIKIYPNLKEILDQEDN